MSNSIGKTTLQPIPTLTRSYGDSSLKSTPAPAHLVLEKDQEAFEILVNKCKELQTKAPKEATSQAKANVLSALIDQITNDENSFPPRNEEELKSLISDSCRRIGIKMDVHMRDPVRTLQSRQYLGFTMAKTWTETMAQAFQCAKEAREPIKYCVQETIKKLNELTESEISKSIFSPLTGGTKAAIKRYHSRGVETSLVLKNGSTKLIKKICDEDGKLTIDNPEDLDLSAFQIKILPYLMIEDYFININAQFLQNRELAMNPSWGKIQENSKPLYQFIDNETVQLSYSLQSGAHFEFNLTFKEGILSSLDEGFNTNEELFVKKIQFVKAELNEKNILPPLENEKK